MESGGWKNASVQVGKKWKIREQTWKTRKDREIPPRVWFGHFKVEPDNSEIDSMHWVKIFLSFFIFSSMTGDEF